MNVLVADDSGMTQLFISSYLSIIGWDHTMVDNGLQAADACMSGNFNVILMSIRMPVLNGLKQPNDSENLIYVYLL